MVVSGTRWKTENSESFALANPMSKFVLDLQSSLIESKACGFLSHAVVFLEVCNELAVLLNQACFGCCIVTTDLEKRQYELSLEEAFYLFHHLKCLEIVSENKRLETSDELWKLIISEREEFPVCYKAYSHLRVKNWVVRSEIKYGVDFVAYHHHPSLVHSEYAVMVSAGNDDINMRLMAWPSIHATVRLEDGVAKTLLILYINDDAYDGVSSLCLQHYTVEEQIVARWNPDQYLQDHTDTEIGNSCDFIHHAQCSPHFHFNKFSMKPTRYASSSNSKIVGLNTRWKGKGSKATALGNPVSELITKLQVSLSQSKVYGYLSGSSVLLEVGIEQADLLNRVCFGIPIVTASEDTHWYELSLEEAFYLFRFLNCVKIITKNHCLEDDDKLWNLMKQKRESFPVFYKAYSHLRAKNWIVRSGIQYGVDFVAYSHHPSLVHSEYAVIVSDCDGDKSTRLLAWPDVHATVRLEGGVAKTLLLLHVRNNCCNELSSSCLECYTVEESTVTRWSAEQCREDKKLVIG